MTRALQVEKEAGKMSGLRSAKDKVAKIAGLGIEFFRDAALYVRYCGISPWQDSQKRRFYKLLIECHAVEKGLSLRDPRPLFGQSKIAFLRRELDRYNSAWSTLPSEMIIGALSTYVALHRERGIDDHLIHEIDNFVAEKRTRLEIAPRGGLRTFEHAYDDVKSLAPADFLASRFSNRTFADTYLDRDRIRRIVALAQSAPSQCNRQATNAYFFQSEERIATLLKLQGGSTGFGHEVRNLFLITSDLAAWGGGQQRNQLYVDGALFSMSLLYALHSDGLAACPLNLAVTNAREREIQTAAGVPRDQRVIMMIAAGEPLTTVAVKVAFSPRRRTDEILHFAD